MKKDYYLYLGQDRKEYFTLPAGWVPLHFVEAEESAEVPSIEQLTREALLKPRGTPPFQTMLSGVKQIAIIVDDGTRPTPVAKILGVLLSHLEESGFSRENISIVVAIGTHETMKQEALEARLGKRRGLALQGRSAQCPAERPRTDSNARPWQGRKNQPGGGPGRVQGRN